jgi:hypothetical protein
LGVKKINTTKLEQKGDEKIQKITKNLESYKGKYIIKDELLYAATPNGQLPVLPTQLRPLFLHMTHDNVLAGHLAISKTKNSLTSLVYWPGIIKDILHYVKNCERCQLTKPIYKMPAGLIVQPNPSQSWQCVSLFCGSFSAKKKAKKIYSSH